MTVAGNVAGGLEHLLAPGRIGALELRNRMVMAPMGEDLGDVDGMVSGTQMAYLEARARGGLAMVMLGSVAVSFPVGCSNARQTAISDDRHIAPWAETARRVHRHGAALTMQLTQAGGNSLNDTMAGRPMWVSSEPGPSGPRRPLRDGHRRRGHQDDGAVRRARVEAASTRCSTTTTSPAWSTTSRRRSCGRARRASTAASCTPDTAT